MEFNGEADHIHLLVEYSPRIALSALVNSLKGVSNRKLRQKFKEFQKEYWGDNAKLWSKSYFLTESGFATRLQV